MNSTYIAPPKSVVASANLPWLEWMAESAPAGGCFVEFGVYLGGSAWYLAKVARQQGRRLYLYDTFTGMPFADDIDPHPKGCFADTSLAMVKEKIPDAIYCVVEEFAKDRVSIEMTKGVIRF